MERNKLTSTCRNRAFSLVLTILNILDQTPRVASSKPVNRDVKVLWFQSQHCRNTEAYQDHWGITNRSSALVLPAGPLSCWFTREDCLKRGSPGSSLSCYCWLSLVLGRFRATVTSGKLGLQETKAGNKGGPETRIPPWDAFPERFILNLLAHLPGSRAQTGGRGSLRQCRWGLGLRGQGRRMHVY